LNFIEKLTKAWDKNNSLLCVGLDPDISKIPEHLKVIENPLFEFCKAIVDQTHDLVCAFKPQAAYFSAESAEGELEMIISYIRKYYPSIPVILDSKRGDIGSTATKYAFESFERYQADAVTVNPYMGFDAAKPFLEYSNKGTILLCRTSNPSAEDFQDLLVDGKPLYLHVAGLAARKWNENKNCLLVVGATWPEQMEEIRKITLNMPFLVPGVGTQGGEIESLVKVGQTVEGTGLIISSSRAVIYASDRTDFAESAREVANNIREKINFYRHYKE